MRSRGKTLIEQLSSPIRISAVGLVVCLSWLVLGSAVAHADAASDYRSAVLTDNPVSYWRLDEDFGPTAADQQGRNPGQVTNATFGQPGPMLGDASMRFGGNGDINLGHDASLRPPGSWTVEAWFRLSAQDAANCANNYPYNGSGTCQLYATHAFGFSVLLSQTGTVNAFVCASGTPGGNSSGCRSAGTSQTYADNKWHYVAVVRDASSLSIFVDGAQQPQATTSTPASTTYYCCENIAAIANDDACGCFPLTGWESEVAFYNYGLSPSRISAHYAAAGPRPSYSPSLNGWPFINQADPAYPKIPYTWMPAFYPASASDMWWQSPLPFVSAVPSELGLFFYTVLFQPAYQGLCYGFSTSSMLEFANGVPTLQSFTSLGSVGASGLGLIRQLHATQDGLASTAVEASQWTGYRALESQGLDGKAAVAQVARDVAVSGPELVLLAPTNVGQAITGVGHAVVAYRVGFAPGQPTPVIYVYDPNVPASNPTSADSAYIAIWPGGGVQLPDASHIGDGTVGSGNGPGDYMALPVGAPFYFAGNARWLLDGANPLLIIFGAKGHQALHSPSFVATGRSELGVVDHRSAGVNGSFRARRAHGVVAEYRKGHVAMVEAEKAGVAFHAHTDKLGELISLHWSHGGEHLKPMIGAFDGPKVSRTLSIQLTKGSGQTLQLSTGTSAKSFSLDGTTTNADSATIGTIQASSLTAPPTSIESPLLLPPRGARATLTALDWRSPGKTLLYEVISKNRHVELVLLHGSIAQARRLPARYRRLLHRCRTMSVRRHHHYRVCRLNK